MKIQFGRRLKAAREEAGLSQEKLGEMVGKDRQQVIRWEAGKAEPKFVDMQRLAEALERPVSWFFEDEEEPSSREILAIVRRLEATVESLRRDSKGGPNLPGGLGSTKR